MGRKERERRVEVFFYGLFMDEELLRGRGLEPEGGEIAAVDGFALRIGQRAALVPTPGAKIYGLVFSLTQSELDRLYSEPSVQAYKRQAVLAQLASGGVAAALCYNVPQPPSPTEEDRVPLVLFVGSLSPCDGARVHFTLLLGTRAALRGAPVQIRYQPNWWFQVVLNLPPKTATQG